jgi:hypothetical protein
VLLLNIRLIVATFFSNVLKPNTNN